MKAEAGVLCHFRQQVRGWRNHPRRRIARSARRAGRPCGWAAPRASTSTRTRPPTYCRSSTPTPDGCWRPQRAWRRACSRWRICRPKGASLASCCPSGSWRRTPWATPRSSTVRTLFRRVIPIRSTTVTQVGPRYTMDRPTNPPLALAPRYCPHNGAFARGLIEIAMSDIVVIERVTKIDYVDSLPLVQVKLFFSWPVTSWRRVLSHRDRDPPTNHSRVVWSSVFWAHYTRSTPFERYTFMFANSYSVRIMPEAISNRY